MVKFFSTSQRFSPGERMLRVLILAFILGVVVYGFWWNSTRTIEMIEARQDLHDPGEELSPEMMDVVRGFKASLQDEFGLDFRMRVAPPPGGETPAVDIAPPDDLDAKTVYMGLDLETGEARVIFPPLVKGALGEGFVAEIRGRLESALDRPDWQAGFIETLAVIYERLETLATQDG
jgi:hypothetical protein